MADNPSAGGFDPGTLKSLSDDNLRELRRAIRQEMTDRGLVTPKKEGGGRRAGGGKGGGGGKGAGGGKGGGGGQKAGGGRKAGGGGGGGRGRQGGGAT